MDVSHDGLMVVYVVTSFDETHNTAHKALWLADVNTGMTSQLTSGDAQDSQPAWSPSGDRIAFVSTRHEGKPQVFTVPLKGGEAQRVTSLPDGALRPVWSPDGSRLCVTSPVKSPCQTVPDETRWFESHPHADTSVTRMRRVTTLESRFDGRGYIDHHFHLFVVDLGHPDGEPVRVTHGDVDNTEAAWSPDGNRIAFVSNRQNDVPGAFLSDLWTVQPDGTNEKCLTNSDLAATSPAWSPDGTRLAFYAHPTDVFAGMQHVWTVSPEGGNQQDVSGSLDRTRRFMHTEYASPSDTPPSWSPDGQAVYCLLGDGNDGAVFRVSLESGDTRRVSQQAGDVAAVQCRGTGERLVGIASTPTVPYEIVVIDSAGGPFVPLTFTNAPLLDAVKLVEPEIVSFKGAHGWDIEGWYIAPVIRHEDTPPPLILEVHGGPQAAWPYGFAFHSQVYAGAGFGSLYINPRGGLGRGFDFVAAGDWGDTDFYDQMAGVDYLIERGDADATRLGVTGISYGGFMTNWIAGHTDRFAAAVSVNGVSNLMSLFGTSDICGPWFMREMGGPFWEDPQQWEKYRHHSPIMYVGNVSTPMLFLQAENDYRCPIEQGEQMLTALRIQGKAAELVRIPGASHSIPDSPLPHQRTLHWQIELEWFASHLRTDSPSNQPLAERQSL